MTGAKQLMQAQALVSHNLANVSTTGFRADLARFEARPDRRARATRAASTRSRRAWASIARRARSCKRARSSTSRSTATVGLPCRRATAAKRTSAARSLKVNSLGLLETERGELVLGDNGPLAVPPYTQIARGRRRHDLDRAARAGPRDDGAGRPPEARESRGRSGSAKRPDGLIEVTDGAEVEPDANVKVASGFIETSNVNIAATLVDMIEFQRQFEVAVRMMQTADQNASRAADLASIS